MKSEIHIFIIWNNASGFFDHIINDLSKHVLIKQVLKVSWSSQNFSENLARFYGANPPPDSGKEKHIGKGPFHLIIVEDRQPIYATRETSKGNLTVNTNIFDLKQKYRSETGGGHKIYATNNLDESKHDVRLILEADFNEYAKSKEWDGKLIEIERDLIGANGWKSISELFDALNDLTTYVVMRNFECLPNEYYIDNHGDIDLLVESLEETIYITNGKKAFQEENRVHYYIKIGNISVPFNFRYVGDNYYDINLQLKMIEEREFSQNGFYMPSIENYFYTLLYHALIHKPGISENYSNRLFDLGSKFKLNIERGKENFLSLLSRFMYRYGFEFTRPIDQSVYYNQSTLLKMYVPSPKLPEDIKDIIDTAEDISVNSDELKYKCNDLQSCFHLSGVRANIMRPFRDVIKGNILEIGAGCGVITRFLGETGANVLALEPCIPRASIAIKRTRDLSNVEVLNKNLEDFKSDKKFDVITLVGILEYANIYTLSETPALSILKIAKKLLKPNGILIIATENQLGLKYLASESEDYMGQSLTYGKNVLKQKINSVGFKKIEFLAPFPDYKFPISIVSEIGFKDNDFDSSIFAIQNFKKDYQLPKSLPFIPEQVLRSLGRNNLSMDISNSFLIIATNRQEGVTNNNYAWHISTSRFQQYCKLKRFTKNEKKGIDVFTEKICFKSSSVIYNQFLVQDLEIQSHYFKGKVLSEDFIDVVSMDGWGEKNLKNFLLKYLHALQNISGMVFPVNKPTTISGDYLDCLPHNIIEIENELFKFFDREWRLKVKIDTGFLVFRAILCLTSSISRFIKPQDYFFDNTILSFIKF